MLQPRSWCGSTRCNRDSHVRLTDQASEAAADETALRRCAQQSTHIDGRGVGMASGVGIRGVGAVASSSYTTVARRRDGQLLRRQVTAEPQHRRRHDRLHPSVTEQTQTHRAEPITSCGTTKHPNTSTTATHTTPRAQRRACQQARPLTPTATCETDNTLDTRRPTREKDAPSRTGALRSCGGTSRRSRVSTPRRPPAHHGTCFYCSETPAHAHASTVGQQQRLCASSQGYRGTLLVPLARVLSRFQLLPRHGSVLAAVAACRPRRPRCCGCS
jgi:hypothetical protein